MSTATQEPETAVTEDTNESNGMLTKRQQDMLDIDRRIISQNHNVREAHQRWIEAKETLSRDRKVYEEQQDRLSKLVDHLEDIESGKPIQQNLFGEPARPEADANQSQDTPEDDTAAEDKAGKKPLAEFADIGEYGLDTGTTETLAEEGVTTVADLEELRDTGRLIPGSIKGFGDKKIELLESFLVAYREEYPKPDAEEESEPSALAPMDEQRLFCSECTDFYQKDDETTDCPDCEGDLELLGYGGDPNINEHGVFVACVEAAPMPVGSETTLHLAQGADGRWYAGFDADSQHYPCDLSGGGYTTRKEAIISTLETIMEDADDDSRTALQSFLDSLEN